MSEIVILYESDHQVRAQALEVSLANRATVQDISQPAVMLPGLKKIIFWGHGTQTTLCGLGLNDTYSLVRNWKKLNSGLDTIEIITCNSAHWVPTASVDYMPKVYRRSALAHRGGAPIDNSFGKKLKRDFKYGSHRSLRGLHVKGLPHSHKGHEGRVSILLWDAPTKTWAFIVGKQENNEAEMTAKKLLLVVKMKPGPVILDKPAEWFSGDNIDGSMVERLGRAQWILHKAQTPPNYKRDGGPTADLAAARMFLNLDLGDCLAGTIHDLRNFLVELK